MFYSYDYVRLAPEEQIAAHRQPEFELTYIISGSGERTLGTVREPFSKGEVVLVPPRLMHCWSFSPDDVDAGGCIENICFHFNPSLPENLGEMFPEMNEALSRLTGVTEALLYTGRQRDRIVGCLLDIGKKTGAERIGEILKLLELISLQDNVSAMDSGSPPGGPERRMEKIRIVVSCNYMRKIRLDDIARHVGMNRTSFCIFFRRRTGRTFMAWLNEFRIAKACDLLSCGTMTISEIASATGFDSLSHFSRTFRSVKGESPSEYRKIRDAKDSPDTGN